MSTPDLIHSSRRLVSQARGTISAGIFVNQAGAIALAQITVYQDGTYEIGDIGNVPRLKKPVLNCFQVAAYPPPQD